MASETSPSYGVPSSYICPLTRLLMEYPYKTCEGSVFEYVAIHEYMCKGKKKDPVTRKDLKNCVLTADNVTRESIQRFIVENPDKARILRNPKARKPREGEDKERDAIAGGKALRDSARKGDIEEVRRLIKAGIPADLPDAQGWTALMWAAYGNKKDTCAVLINEGKAKANVENKHGDTPLTWAACFNHLDTLKFLVEDGNADVNYKTTTGATTALIVAAQEDHLETVKYLVEVAGAVVNMRGGARNLTAIEEAKDEGNDEIHKYLAKHKAVSRTASPRAQAQKQMPTKASRRTKSVRSNPAKGHHRANRRQATQVMSGRVHTKDAQGHEKQSSLFDFLGFINQSSESQVGKRTKGSDAKDSSNPVWIPDAKAYRCMIDTCKRRFGILVRKHHCRKCGIIICHKCSKQKMQVPGYDQPQRVCDDCVRKICEMGT
mmetsp:Transcript_29733/g.57388  ORF Transcript_29733/g.57388 Transcript_29733/m.57388 type:complete len:434 (-) Transcript_29733:100-1401(-)